MLRAGWVLSVIVPLALPNCLFLFFINLKLELLTQFPASNDEKCFYFMKTWKRDHLKNGILWASITNYFI